MIFMLVTAAKDWLESNDLSTAKVHQSFPPPPTLLEPALTIRTHMLWPWNRPFLGHVPPGCPYLIDRCMRRAGLGDGGGGGNHG